MARRFRVVLSGLPADLSNVAFGECRFTNGFGGVATMQFTPSTTVLESVMFTAEPGQAIRVEFAYWSRANQALGIDGQPSANPRVLVLVVPPSVPPPPPPNLPPDPAPMEVQFFD